MTSSEILSSYIKKLSHPLKEIRDRSLQLLLAKLQLGWELQDELSNTRELLETLLAWFNVPQPCLQQEALRLLLILMKTDTGTYIAREFGVKRILSTLKKVKSKIEPAAMGLYEDVMETLKFLNTVVSAENVNVPPLALHSMISSESDRSLDSCYYNIPPNVVQSSKNTSVSNEEIATNRLKKADGVKVLLFPWLELCSSDSKTMLLVEDALKLQKSTRRCCRFIRDVFLRDFPAEIFLNRPAIVQSLLTIVDGRHGGRPGEALHVLLYISCSLRTRLNQLSSLELIHDTNKAIIEHRDSDDRVNVALEQFAGDGSPRMPVDDALIALRQLPAPIFALDTLHTVLSVMTRSVVLVDGTDKYEVLDLKELNMCLKSADCLVQLLLDCVSEDFWCSEHSTKTHRDIAHKSCMVMRLMGELLMKYRKSYYEDSERYHHRVAWLRLISCAEKLLYWARESAMPPSSLLLALQAAQLDPALELLYPDLSKKVSLALETARKSIDQEYKSKYRELRKLFSSMEDAAQFMKNRRSSRNSSAILTCIKNSLAVIEIHLSETYLNEIIDIILNGSKEFDFEDSDWSTVRSIALNLMANRIEWVREKFYKTLAEMVKLVLVGNMSQSNDEKSLTLLCDVEILTEICCHGVCSENTEVKASASEIMLYLLRGRLVLSESCWWRLLASLLPVLPLLHVYAAHDSQLGQAICKSLEPDIAECMGVSLVEVTAGLVRLLFVRCPAVQMDAALALCRLLDDDKYLPPKESLRTDVLISALNRIQPSDFNIDFSGSPSKVPEAIGLIQMLDVLKQDIVLDELGSEFVPKSTMRPTLEPSLRRSTLQQLSVMMRQQELHETFLQSDGIKIIVAILRMSMMVDDYLAFPECAISCVSLLNSVCFVSRHTLAKIPDLSSLLIRVILVFPANELAVLMSAQIMALVAWSGFALQELDTSRHRIPALPSSVVERTSLPFNVCSYWKTSPNAEHSSIEWLLSHDDFRAAIRVRWWCAYEGGSRVLLGAPPPPTPLTLRPTSRDLDLLRAACPKYSCTKALLHFENATSHRQVNDALCILESYTNLLQSSSVGSKEFSALPWQHMKRFLGAPPASARDTALLISLLQFIITYMDNVPIEGNTMSWIKSSFIGSDCSIVSLLSREELYPQQSPQDNIEVVQLHIHIVRVVLRCIIQLEDCNEYDSSQMESLVKILLCCLTRIDLKNFHMLGFLNELVRCIRYALNSQYCKLSEDTIIRCLKQMTTILSGCASGGGHKGQACRLDAILSLLALLQQIYKESIPVQRWTELWNSDVVTALVNCSKGARAELRAASLLVMTALAHYAQLLPQLLQAISEVSLCQYAAGILAEVREANVVRTAAAKLLVAITARASPHSDVLEYDVLEQLKEHNFLEICLEILVDFCDEKNYSNSLQLNIPLSVLERRPELEVRARKCEDVYISPLSGIQGRAPPTAELIVAVADILHNVSIFPHCPVKAWNERGLYRLLFRCVSWSCGSVAQVSRTRAAASRTLSTASTHKCVRTTLAATKDCLHNLMMTLTPLNDDELDADSVSARIQALLFLGSLLAERSASDSVWQALRDQYSVPFFHTILQSLSYDDRAFQDAAAFCLTQLASSVCKNKHPDKTKDQSCVQLLDNLKSPFIQDTQSGRYGAGDSGKSDCQPEYMIEEICKILMYHYQDLPLDIRPNQDDRWSRVCSCLCSILSVSARSRLYGVHRHMPRLLLVTLQAVRDHLALQGSTDVIKTAAQNPILRILYWLLSVINCHMLECPPAKESFADDNIALSLNRLWPWCMLTDQLRDTVMHLLVTFTNGCAKAWAAMSMCVGGRSLIGEVCALTTREAALQSRPRPETLLLLCLRTLRHTVSHQHCRSIILKSEALSCIYKVRVSERGWNASGVGVGVGVEWARACEAAARHADGAAAVLALAMRPLLAAPQAPAPLRARLMPALAHLARHRRHAVLHSPDILELLSGTLLAGDTAEIVSAARAVWALAANNHKAKLQLRSAGVTAAVQAALQRMRRESADAASQRALQLLIYTNNVLQTT